MHTRRIAGAIILAVLVPAVASGIAADAAKRSECQRLSGKDLAPAPSVKLVTKANQGGGTDLVGCVLPRGGRFVVGSSGDVATRSDRYRLRQVAGRMVLMRGLHGNQYGRSEHTFVSDLRSGRGYRLAFLQSPLGSPAGSGETAPAAFVTKRGRSVAALRSVDGTLTIASFDPAGGRSDLDSGPQAQIPSESLALRGTIATWTHDGAPRRADIAAR